LRVATDREVFEAGLEGVGRKMP
ncbi:hypothetical protein LCGC14_2826910, partial [marine sediment metagenome]